MDQKLRISPQGTYVLDDDDIEQLEDLSPTSANEAEGESPPQPEDFEFGVLSKG